MSIRSATAENNGGRNRPTDAFKRCEDLDDILDIIGSQGKYQKFFLYVILSPVIALQPLLSLNLLFMLYEPKSWCKVPGRESYMSADVWKNMTIPKKTDGSFSKCSRFGPNHTEIGCTSGWEYDLTDYDHTIPMDFNWVCDKSEWATWGLTANAVGNAIGTVVLGHYADTIGRRPMFILSIFLNIFGRIASMYVAHNFWWFMGLTTITGVGFPIIYILPILIGAEFSGKEYRAWVYSYTWIIWVVGEAAIPGIAKYSRDWFLIGWLTTVPCLALFVCCMWVPESPRWLLSKGKVDKVAVIIKMIARWNKTSDKLTDSELKSLLKQIVIKQDQCDEKYSVATLFTRWRLAKNTILVTISWVMNAVIYYIIILNTSNLAGDQFLNFFVLAVIEGPAGYMGSVSSDWIGRRWTQVGFFVITVVSSLVAGVAVDFPNDYAWKIVSLVAAVVAKFSVTLTFLIVYLQAAEVFPTPLRSTGSGFASTVASLAGIFTPLIVSTSKYDLGAPWFIVVVMSVVGVLSSAYIPETLNQNLPETVEDAANFGKDVKFWSLRPPPPKVANNINTRTAEAFQ